jgi:hypothetical protein
MHLHARPLLPANASLMNLLKPWLKFLVLNTVFGGLFSAYILTYCSKLDCFHLFGSKVKKLLKRVELLIRKQYTRVEMPVYLITFIM